MPSLNLQNFADSSGNNHGLTLGGSAVPAFQSDPFGIGAKGCVFDETVQFSCYGPEWAPAAGDYTFEWRFARNTSQLGTVQALFGRWGTVSGSAEYQYLCYWDTDNTLKFLHATSSSGTGVTVASAAITDATARAFRVVYASGALSLYVDGTRVAGPSAAAALPSVSVYVPFMVGMYADRSNASDASGPLHGVMGDLMLSNVARSTGASYAVSSSPLVSDANTVALIRMDRISGNFLAAPTFHAAALRRTGYSQASGGWANPDGPLPKIGGGWFFSVSAYNGSQWTCWAVTASTLADLLAGNGTVGAQAIQTPSTGEGDLAANGTVIAWGGTYYHYYHDSGGSGSVRYSSGSDLGAPFSPQPGNVLFTGYADPWVRPSSDGASLVMYLVKNATVSPNRHIYRSTSTDGTTWSAPTLAIEDVRCPAAAFHPGEFSNLEEFTSGMWGWSDGATASGQPRRVVRWAKRGSSEWVPLGMHFGPSGSDSGSNAYLATFDSSPYYDAAAKKIYILAAHSTNSEPTQPTNSDIGVWVMDLEAGIPALSAPGVTNVATTTATPVVTLTY